MSQAFNIALLVLLLLPLWWAVRKDFLAGLTYGIFLCVTAPGALRIPLPGELPDLTIFRLAFIILFIFWLKERRRGRFMSPVPFAGVFLVWALTNLLSLLLTDISFGRSLKRYLDFVLEFWGFYVIATTAITSRADTLKVLRATILGLGVVAVLAFIEKYSGFNPTDLLTAEEEGVKHFGTVTATYRHRILLGTGLAMGLPLGLALARCAVSTREKFVCGCITVLIAGACYFAYSRGPWIGVVLAGLALFVLGTSKIRKGLVCILCLAVLVLVMRPGVFTTISSSAKATADPDSFKGGTFMYRLELWRVAATEISKSPVRLLFGYGQGAGLEKEIEWDLSFRGKAAQIWSWDNHYAYDLFQTGIMGLLAKVVLYFAIGYKVFKLQRGSSGAERDMLAALFSSLLVLFFMMSNVLIFAKQLNFLFNAVAAGAFAFGFHNQIAIPVASQNGNGLFSKEGLELENVWTQGAHRQELHGTHRAL